MKNLTLFIIFCSFLFQCCGQSNKSDNSFFWEDFNCNNDTKEIKDSITFNWYITENYDSIINNKWCMNTLLKKEIFVCSLIKRNRIEAIKYIPDFYKLKFTEDTFFKKYNLWMEKEKIHNQYRFNHKFTCNLFSVTTENRLKKEHNYISYCYFLFGITDNDTIFDFNSFFIEDYESNILWQLEHNRQMEYATMNIIPFLDSLIGKYPQWNQLYYQKALMLLVGIKNSDLKNSLSIIDSLLEKKYHTEILSELKVRVDKLLSLDKNEKIQESRKIIHDYFDYLYTF